MVAPQNAAYPTPSRVLKSNLIWQVFAFVCLPYLLGDQKLRMADTVRRIRRHIVSAVGRGMIMTRRGEE